MVVAVASASITTVLPVAAADMAPKWSSDCSIKDAGALSTWLPAVPAVAEVVMPWMRMAECADPKASPCPVDSLASCLID